MSSTGDDNMAAFTCQLTFLIFQGIIPREEGNITALGIEGISYSSKDGFIVYLLYNLRSLRHSHNRKPFMKISVLQENLAHGLSIVSRGCLPSQHSAGLIQYPCCHR